MEKKNRRGPYGLCECRPRSFLICWGMLGSLDGSVWLQEDSLCLLVMRVAHGTEMSYNCRTLMQIIWACESKDLSSLMALMQLRKWKMFLNSTINCQTLWEKIINSALITFEQTAYPILVPGGSKRNIVCFCLVWVVKRSENLYWCKP